MVEKFQDFSRTKNSQRYKSKQSKPFNKGRTNNLKEPMQNQGTVAEAWDNVGSPTQQMYNPRIQHNVKPESSNRNTVPSLTNVKSENASQCKIRECKAISKPRIQHKPNTNQLATKVARPTKPIPKDINEVKLRCQLDENSREEQTLRKKYRGQGQSSAGSLQTVIFLVTCGKSKILSEHLNI